MWGIDAKSNCPAPFHDGVPMFLRHTLQAGFTLYELLIVVSILVVLGGGVIGYLSNIQSHAYFQVAQGEMQTLRNAILQYQHDNGSLPVPYPADFSFLLDCPDATLDCAGGAIPAWDISSARGWRGPYLVGASDGHVDAGDNLLSDGSGNPFLGNTTRVHGVADPFITRPIFRANQSLFCESDSTDSTDLCRLDWHDQGGEIHRKTAGRPYLLFDTGSPDAARIVSMGPDGRYAGVNSADACQPAASSDDIVICLFR